MKKFVCVLMDLAALLANVAAQDVAVFPQVGHTDIVTSVAFSPDGKTVVSCSGDTTLKIWDTETGREIKKVFRESGICPFCSVQPRWKGWLPVKAYRAILPCSELSNGRQNPTTITPNGYVNFILAGTEKK